MILFLYTLSQTKIWKGFVNVCPVTPPRSVVELDESEKKTVNIRSIDKVCSILSLSCFKSFKPVVDLNIPSLLIIVYTPHKL